MSYKNKQKNVTHFMYSQLFQLFQEKIQQYSKTLTIFVTFTPSYLILLMKSFQLLLIK